MGGKRLLIKSLQEFSMQYWPEVTLVSKMEKQSKLVSSITTDNNKLVEYKSRRVWEKIEIETSR